MCQLRINHTPPMPLNFTPELRSHAIVVAPQQIVQQQRNVGMIVALRVDEAPSRIVPLLLVGSAISRGGRCRCRQIARGHIVGDKQ